MTTALDTTDALDSECSSGVRQCADIWVRARRVPSDFPAPWVFTAELIVECDASIDCACDVCFEQRRARIQAKCDAVEATLDIFAIEEMVARDNESWSVLVFRAQLMGNVESDNDNDVRSTLPTSRAPKMSVSESAELELEAV